MSSAPTILYADDDAEDRMLMQAACEESGLHGSLLCFEDGQELIDWLRGQDKDRRGAISGVRLIVLDFNMPRKDARETLQEIKSDASIPDIPIVLFTTSHSDTHIVQARRLGAAAFFTKPTQCTKLREIIGVFRKRWLEPSSPASPGMHPRRAARYSEPHADSDCQLETTCRD